METLVKGTSRTPQVSVNAATGILDITGNFIPDNAISFFETTAIKIRDFARSTQQKVTVNVRFNYLNSSSYKVFMEIFKTLSEKENVEFNWHYNNDEEILEFGKMCETVTQKPFNFYGLKDL